MASPYLDADMHHKICKKMAQLTRVIHKMNMINEQNEVLLNETVKDYENEIERIVTECNGLLVKTKALAEKSSKADEIKDKVKKLEADIETEKKRSKRDFDALKAKVEERDKKAAGDLEVIMTDLGEARRSEGSLRSAFSKVRCHHRSLRRGEEEGRQDCRNSQVRNGQVYKRAQQEVQ